jgi:O-antigen/teichoic acid export membrane protein
MPQSKNFVLSIHQRAAWGLLDQALSSLTNFVLVVMVARSVQPRQFGVFALVLAVYFVALGLSEGVATAPLSVRYSDVTGVRFREAAVHAAGTALAFGCIGGLACLLLGVAIPGVSFAFGLLAVSLPGLLLQDAWRFTFVAQGRPGQAALNDALWAVLQIGGSLVVVLTARGSTPVFVGIWGGAATVAAVCGAAQLPGLPRPSQALHWLREHRRLAWRYAAEALLVRGSLQLALILLGGVAGVAAVGALRGAQVLFSPLNLVYLGGLLVAVPEAVRILDSHRFRGLVALVSIGTGLLAILWAVIVALLPYRIGLQLLGQSWPSARPLVLLVAIQNLATAVSIGPQVGLRAMAAASQSLACQLAYAGLLVASAGMGAFIGGVWGAATGIAISTLAGALVWWLVYETYKPEHGLLRHDTRPVTH